MDKFCKMKKQKQKSIIDFLVFLFLKNYHSKKVKIITDSINNLGKKGISFLLFRF